MSRRTLNILARRFDSEGNELASLAVRTWEEKRRVEAQQRANILRSLGWADEVPELGMQGRYTATTEQLLGYLRENLAAARRRGIA